MARKSNGKSRNLDMERRRYTDLVIQYFNDATVGSLHNYRQVSAAIGASTPKQRALVVETLEQLSTDGFINEVENGRYKVARRTMVELGTFSRRSNGKNSVVLDSDESATPILVAERNSMHALNGDRVQVHLSAVRAGMEPEAVVTKIVERKEQVFTGTLKIKKYYAILQTDSRFLATDIFIPLEGLGKATTGDKVVVRIADWPDGSDSPLGEIVDILGKAGENDAEIHAILAEFGLPYKYPENVERAAKKIEPGITEDEVARRRDMRDVTTFTIDPADAKDYDDALSIRRLDNGRLEIGVHIADVSYYVTPGTVIDKEARERATSVYLVDRTVPMLPEHLCNFICSLRPDEDKLTYSVILEMDDNAKVHKTKICHTVTRSNRRFSYEEAQAILEAGKGEYADELLTLDRLAKLLRDKRFADGSVAFNRVEKSFKIDADGKPVEVILHESKDANKLIEEFMLLANRKVAEHIGKVSGSRKAKAMVYRVHDEPDREKLTNVAEVAAHFGHKLKVNGSRKEVNRSINRMLEKVKDTPQDDLLSMLAIKAMAKAVYSTGNVGHYGLAFDYYTHFTSPIRRYPDLMVHRLLDRYAAKGARSVNEQKLEEECKHCSSQEQLAANAERASIKYKEVEYMGERLGKVYTGKVSGVTEWGLYVECDETHCEGMVPVRELDDDFYEYDEKNFLLRGRRSGHKYQLGDTVTIQVARADLVKKQLDFAIVTKNNPPFSHRIDKAPVTYQSILERESLQDLQRAQYEGGTASRRRKHGRQGNSTKRNAVAAGGRATKGAGTKRSRKKSGGKQRRNKK